MSEDVSFGSGSPRRRGRGVAALPIAVLAIVLLASVAGGVALSTQGSSGSMPLSYGASGYAPLPGIVPVPTVSPVDTATDADFTGDLLDRLFGKQLDDYQGDIDTFGRYRSDRADESPTLLLGTPGYCGIAVDPTRDVLTVYATRGPTSLNAPVAYGGRTLVVQRVEAAHSRADLTRAVDALQNGWWVALRKAHVAHAADLDVVDIVARPRCDGITVTYYGRYGERPPHSRAAVAKVERALETLTHGIPVKAVPVSIDSWDPDTTSSGS